MIAYNCESLCNLCVFCVTLTNVFNFIHTGGAEDAEVAHAGSHALRENDLTGSRYYTVDPNNLTSG